MDNARYITGHVYLFTYIITRTFHSLLTTLTVLIWALDMLGYSLTFIFTLEFCLTAFFGIVATISACCFSSRLYVCSNLYNKMKQLILRGWAREEIVRIPYSGKFLRGPIFVFSQLIARPQKLIP